MCASLLVTGGGRALAAGPAAPNRWDLAPLYADDAAWDADASTARTMIAQVAKMRGRLGSDATTMFTTLRMQSDAERKVWRLVTYASLKADEDMSVSSNQSRAQTASGLLGDLTRASSFVAPEVAALGEARTNAFLSAEPRLRSFRSVVGDIRRRADHFLGEEAEGVVAATRAPFEGPLQVMQRLSNSDIPRPEVTSAAGGRVVLTDDAFRRLTSSVVRSDRKTAFEALYASYRPFRDTLATDLLAQVRQDEFVAQVRRYPDALGAQLDPMGVPAKVFQTFITEANAGLPLLHGFQDLKRRILGVERLAFHDSSAPLVADGAKYSLDDMRANLLAAVAPLGRDYASRLAAAMGSGWEDPFPRPNKTPSVYNSPFAYDVHPYLSFNLSDDYASMTGYAHEWGHAMHSVLANSVQPYETSQYSPSIAEVPSQLNEILLARHMASTARGARARLFYTLQQLQLWSAHFFGSALQGEFADGIHRPVEKGEGITGGSISDGYLALLRRYNGPAMEVDAIYGLGWMRNFQYWLGYYPFQYGTCITAAGVFADELLGAAPDARARYLALLRAGGSDHAYALLTRAGVDLATPGPYRRVLQSFRSLLEEAEAMHARMAAPGGRRA